MTNTDPRQLTPLATSIQRRKEKVFELRVEYNTELRRDDVHFEKLSEMSAIILLLEHEITEDEKLLPAEQKVIEEALAKQFLLHHNETCVCYNCRELSEQEAKKYFQTKYRQE